MIAHDGKDSVGSIQLAKHIVKAVKFASLMVDQIARKHYGIAVLSVDKVHDSLHVTLMSVMESPDVHIGKLDYAITVERLWQIIEIECLMTYHKVVSSPEIACTQQEKGEESQAHGENPKHTPY
jgi:DUF917 family protein